MKKLLLTIFIIIFTASFTKADDKDSYIKLKSIKSLSDIHSIECDLCGCYLGVEPKFGNNSVGFRYSYFRFHSDPVIVPVDVPVPEHETDPKGETEIFSKIELVAKFNLNTKLRLFLTIPYKLNDINGKYISDFGDVSILGQYLVYSTEMSFKNETRYRHRFYIGGGLSIPTGAFNNQLIYGITEPHFQTGTGAFSFLVNGSYYSKFREFGLSLDAAYSTSLANKSKYRFADRLNLAANLSYEFGINEIGLLPHAGLYYESAGFDNQKDLEVDDSGGKVLFITGGIDSYFSHFSFNINYEYPLSQNLNGTQTENKFRVITGLTYFFGM
ncbi:hypothetical protein BH10BAC5_BH10BAC5_27450 [soil metagenome]